MHMCEQWWLHCTSQWGGRGHWVSTCTVWPSDAKGESRVRNLLYKLCVMLRVVQEATAMSNWWLAASSQKNTPAHACIESHVEFLAKHQFTQVTQPLYSPDLVPWDFWLFPKLKSPLKGKKFQTIDGIQENTMGAADGDWENCVRSHSAYLEGDWGVIVLCTVFLVSSINISIFPVHGWTLSGQTLCFIKPAFLGIYNLSKAMLP